MVHRRKGGGERVVWCKKCRRRVEPACWGDHPDLVTLKTVRRRG